VPLGAGGAVAAVAVREALQRDQVPVGVLDVDLLDQLPGERRPVGEARGRGGGWDDGERDTGGGRE